LRDLEEGSKEFHELVDNAITKENALLQKQADKLKADAADAHEKASTFEAMALQKQKDFERSEGEKLSALKLAEEAVRKATAAEGRADEAERNLNRISEESAKSINDHGTAIQVLQDQLGRYTRMARIAGAVLFGVAGVTGILLVRAFVAWSWLENHPNRLGLEASAILTILCFGWAIADKKRRTIALLVLVVPILMAVITMLGK
jgi:hypothetical protein